MRTMHSSLLFSSVLSRTQWTQNTMLKGRHQGTQSSVGRIYQKPKIAIQCYRVLQFLIPPYIHFCCSTLVSPHHLFTVKLSTVDKHSNHPFTVFNQMTVHLLTPKFIFIICSTFLRSLSLLSKNVLYMFPLILNRSFFFMKSVDPVEPVDMTCWFHVWRTTLIWAIWLF